MSNQFNNISNRYILRLKEKGIVFKNDIEIIETTRDYWKHYSRENFTIEYDNGNWLVGHIGDLIGSDCNLLNSCLLLLLEIKQRLGLNEVVDD